MAGSLMTSDAHAEHGPFTYGGSELELFAEAVNWKAYWMRHVRQFIRGDVLEVGAGIGANTQMLCSERVRRWLCLEPDPRQAARLRTAVSTQPDAQRIEIVIGGLGDLQPDARFDTILYVDVLEHIANDREELTRAEGHLRPDGALIVLAPAHPRLFGRFDAALGHHRRYTRRGLAAIMPPSLTQLELMHLDSCGLLALLGNRILLRQSVPSRSQVLIWDRVMVPASRWLDTLTGHRVGKSVLGIWQKAG